MTDRTLKPTLGLFSAVMLAISVVVGAGMLMLPGLVFQTAGRDAYWSWIGDSLLSVPLLWVFIRLGRAYPSAGGVSSFVGAAWPQAQAGVAYVLLGTFGLGIPSIALTGGYYAVEGLGIGGAGGGAMGGATGACLVAAAMLAAAAAIVHRGATLASRWQNTVMVVLIVLLVALAGSTLPRWGREFHLPEPAALPAVWQGMALAFFSYTGWELFAALSEEMKNPRRDFPLAVIVSFVAVSLLYLGAALAVQSTVDAGDPLVARAPFLPVAGAVLGHAAGEAALAATVFLVIFANLVGAVWAASRLVFDMGRNGFLPAALRTERLDARSTPTAALGVVLVIFLAAIGLHRFGGASLDVLLTLAGQNFFLLYLACVAVFLKVTEDRREKAFALLALVGLLAFAGIFGWSLLYPLALFAIPTLARRAGPGWRPSHPPSIR